MKKASRSAGLSNSEQAGCLIFPMQGTKFDEEGRVVTNGGQVLGVTALGKDSEGSAGQCL